MKKKLILALAILLGCAGLAKADVLANTKYFPDEQFLAWVLSNFHKIRGERLTDEELASVKTIDIGSGAKSLKGIEYFTELESLYISNGDGYLFSSKSNIKGKRNASGNIKEVDLSKNKKLKSFYFHATDSYYGDIDVNGTDNPYNPFYGYSTKSKASHVASSSTYYGMVRLKSVNLANLPELRVVDIENHALTNLDLRGCPNLQKVVVYDSENAVDVKLDTCANLETFANSNCAAGVKLPDFALMPNLKVLMCDDGKITKLDLSGLANSLEVLSCSDNPMTSLDLSKCTKLRSLRCENLPVTSLDCSQLDSLKSINVANCSSLQSFPALPSCVTTIMCDGVKAFANVDLSQYSNLMFLHAENCGLTKFDISKYPNLYNLTWLYLNNNNIAAPNLSGVHYVWKYGQSYNGYKIDKQEVYVSAIQMRRGLGDYWRLILPDDVDLRKIMTLKFVDDDWGGKYKLYEEYYEDGQGNLKPSLVTNLPYMDNYSFHGVIRYSYKTGGILTIYDHQKEDNIVSGVTVYAKCDASGVDDVAAAKVVKGVKYFDLQGHESAEPFSGFNIEVTQYTDGTSQSRKLVR